LKNRALEIMTWLFGKCSPTLKNIPTFPKKIFIFRNSEIGDLLNTTPLFRALKENFPNTKLIVGIGEWNKDVLKGNPFVDQVVVLTAPWRNYFHLPKTPLDPLMYLLSSPEIEEVRKLNCDIGIDLVGTHLNSWFLLRCGIPFRVGVKGYFGGHSCMQLNVEFDPWCSVAQAYLKSATLLGAKKLPPSDPELFLSPEELIKFSHNPLILIAPGGGAMEKCWPESRYLELIKLLKGHAIGIIGGKKEIALGERLSKGSDHVQNFVGKTNLRETFSLIASSRLMISNSSMAVHAAAAYKKKCIMLLNETFPAAEQHFALWGHPDTLSVGNENGRISVPTADRVAKIVLNLIGENS